MQIELRRIGVSLIVLYFLGCPTWGRADEPAAKAPSLKKNQESIDPFATEDKATAALTGIWQLSATVVVKVPQFAPSPVAPAPAYQATTAPPHLRTPDGTIGFPLDPTSAAERKNQQVTTVQRDQRMTTDVRLDLRDKSKKFRIEIAQINHSQKACEYIFAEGQWTLRGRLLVLTFVLDDDVDRWAFFIERLSAEEIAVKGVEDWMELLADGRGAFVKKKAPSPISIPDGYSVSVDSTSFGPVATDLVKYLRSQLDLPVRLANEKQ